MVVRFILGLVLGLMAAGGVNVLVGDPQLAVAIGALVAITIMFWAWGRVAAREVEDVHRG